MNNPYSVLGVNESATDEEIKEAYRNLARKYQNDSYASSPLSEIAKKKMEELDFAYDSIVQQRRGQTNYSSNYSYSNTQDNSNYATSQFYDVREKIKAGRIDDAETILDGVPRDMRSAEWHYLKGQIQQRRGWFDEAYKNYSTACQKDPSNVEYTNAFNSLNKNMSGGYRQTHGTGGGCSGCDICSGLICADCCCESLGGDCIPCC